MTHGFNPNLFGNFNHLLYDYDLILIAQASRQIAHNINLCFSIYENLTGQRANKAKSEIYFPTRFNKRLSKSISKILEFKIGSFPFVHLGILISPEKLALSYFSSMIDTIEKTISIWRKSRISSAKKNILINSSLLKIPLHYLSVYPVLDSILNIIKKLSGLSFGIRVAEMALTLLIGKKLLIIVLKGALYS